MVGKCQNEALRRALFFGMVMSGSCAGAKKTGYHDPAFLPEISILLREGKFRIQS
jgi:hypothetical protein